MDRTPDDLPVKKIVEIGQRWGQRIQDNTKEQVVSAMEEHVETMHLPPRRSDPVTAVPFPDARIPDLLTCQGIEYMRQGHTVEEAADFINVDALVLERAIVDYRAPYNRWLVARGY